MTRRVARPEPGPTRTAPTVLVLRAEEAGRRVADALRRAGLEPLLAPLTRIVPLDAPAPHGPFDAVLATSAHAAPALAAWIGGAGASPPVYAVGAETARSLRDAGVHDVRTALGDAAALAVLVLFDRGQANAKGGGRGRVLHVAGRHRKPSPARELEAAGFEVSVWEVYDAEAAAELPGLARAALSAGRVDAALHFSRRSAALYLSLADEAGLRGAALAPRHFAASEDVAAPLRAAGAHVELAPLTAGDAAAAARFVQAALAAPV